MTTDNYVTISEAQKIIENRTGRPCSYTHLRELCANNEVKAIKEISRQNGKLHWLIAEGDILAFKHTIKPNVMGRNRRG